MGACGSVSWDAGGMHLKKSIAAVYTRAVFACMTYSCAGGGGLVVDLVCGRASGVGCRVSGVGVWSVDVGVWRVEGVCSVLTSSMSHRQGGSAWRKGPGEHEVDLSLRQRRLLREVLCLH